MASAQGPSGPLCANSWPLRCEIRATKERLYCTVVPNWRTWQPSAGAAKCMEMAPSMLPAATMCWCGWNADVTCTREARQRQRAARVRAFVRWTRRASLQHKNSRSSCLQPLSESRTHPRGTFCHPPLAMLEGSVQGVGFRVYGVGFWV